MDVWLRLLLVVILVGAGWSDVCRGKVYNWWLLSGAAAGLVLRRTDFLIAAVVFLIPGFVLFRFRMMGAGDGKLIAVIGGYLGIESGLKAVAAGLTVGAVWSLWRLCHGGCFRVRMEYLMAYCVKTVRTGQAEPYDVLDRPDGGERIPLAACLAAGGLVYLLAVRLGIICG